MMNNIWHKMVLLPVRRLWLALSARLNLRTSRKNGAGLLKLEDDVQTCEYQDIQVMWEMLRRTESGHIDKHLHKHKQHFWRMLEWSSSHTEAASLESTNHT